MVKKTIFKNYIFNLTYSLLNIIIPIITIPYISRILLAEGVGQVSYAQNIVSYFVVIASLGIPNYAIREIAKKAENISDRSKIFWEIFLINLASTIIATVSYLLIIMNFSYFSNNRSLYYIVGISLVLNAFNIDWFYKGIEEFKYITIRSYIIKILSLIAIFIFVRTKEDVIVYAFIVTVATSSNYIFNIIHMRKYLNKISVHSLKLKRHLKPIFFMFATAIAVELYIQLDITMIGAICGDTYVGYYSNSIKLTKIVIIVITAIGSVLLPRLSGYFENNEINKLGILVTKTVEYIIFISIPCSLGLFLVSADLVVVLFGTDFLPAITTMRILALLIPIISIGNIFGIQLMIVLNQEKLLTLTVFIGAIINITLNSVLISVFQQNGAATASVITEFVVMVAQILLTRKFVEIHIDIKICFKILVQAIVMVVVIWLIRMFDFNNTLRLIVEVFSGGVAYILAGLVLKNELIYEILIKLKRLIRK